MKDPAFLFYSQDFYMGTLDMTHDDVGKYIRLLCVMHQKGRLDEETIRLLVGSVSVSLKSKFLIDENGLWFNERLELEAEKRAQFVDSRRVNGKKGGRPKKANGKAKENHMVRHMPNLRENENNRLINKKEKGGAGGKNILLKAEFEKFRKLYPGTKRGEEVEWKDFKDRWKKEVAQIVPELIPSLTRQRKQKADRALHREFVPEWKHLATYLGKQRGWEEEFPRITETVTGNKPKTI